MTGVQRLWDRRRSSSYEKGLWELRESLSSRVGELEALLATRTAREPDSPEVRALASRAAAELAEALETLHHGHPRQQPEAHLAVAQAHYDAAHSLVLRLSPLKDVKGMLPGLVAFIREHLPVTDERRVHAEEIGLSIRAGGTFDALQREVIVDTMTVARQAHLRETRRVRSFAYIVFGMAAALTVIVVLVGLFGALSPDTVPLCFNPDRQEAVCPTASNMGAGGDDGSADAQSAPHDLDDLYSTVASRWDYPVVEFVGIVAAAVAAAASLRRIRGTSTPYNVPVALALLKLPTGALTAVLGLLLMRGEFVPGLRALDSSAQIIAWAVIFGYAQQLFTRFVDSQAQSVLNSVGGPSKTPAKPVREPHTA